MNNMPSYGSWGYPPPDYRSELMKARASEKRALNMNVCLLAGLLLLYNLFNRMLVYVYYYLAYIRYTGSFTPNFRTVLSYLQENELTKGTGFTMTANLFIVSVSAILLVSIAQPVMKIKVSDMVKPYRGFVRDGAMWTPLSITFNILIGLIAGMITTALNNSGISVPKADFSITSPSHYAIIIQLVYVCVIGPVIEELVYRGIIIKLLSPYGRLMSAFMSALIFGLMHGNISQALSAFGGGLIYALITVRYNSIAPTIVMHIINNTIASIPDISKAVGYDRGSDISLTIQIVILFAGFYAMFVMLSQLLRQISSDEPKCVLHEGERFKIIFTNILLLLYFAYIIGGYVRSFIRANGGG